MKDSQNPDQNGEEEEDDEDLLTLSLSTKPTGPPPPPPPPPPPLQPPTTSSGGPSRQNRTRRSPFQTLKPGQSEFIPPPYPWATSKRATVHSLEYLLSNDISKIYGDVLCKRCEQQYEMEYDLQDKFMGVASFISKNKSVMHDRAPSIWMNPTLPDCKFCGQKNCAKPILSTKKKSINWLFLLLGQLLGCCKLNELKYFCKHTKNHRTGAKDRVLYLTYLGLCKQLDPNGPFDR